MNLASAAIHLPLEKVNPEFIGDKNRITLILTFLRRMSEGDADSGQEFAGAERLCQIVVRPSVEGLYFIPFLLPCRDDDNG